jgi:hypothetical protein
MPRHTAGTPRSSSIAFYLRPGRVAACFAIFALVAGIVSDSAEWRFWERHALIAGIVGSLLVVMLSVAILDEAIERRRRRRWKVLAQYVMLQLAFNARLIWTAVAELAGQMPSGARTASALDAGFRVVRDTPSLTKAVEGLVADSESRLRLREELGHFGTSSEEMLARWAAVMLNGVAYAELIDRHVELVSHVSWLDGLLHFVEPVGEEENQHSIKRRLAAVQADDENEQDHLVTRIVTMTQLAAELDSVTLRLALRVVSVDWWAEQLGLGAAPRVWTAKPIAPAAGQARPSATASSS